MQTNQPSNQSNPPYNLEERTFNFAQKVIDYVSVLPQNVAHIEINKQLVRSAGSVGANYIEANEALGKKDFIMKIRTFKREAKESRYWLKLTRPKPDMTEEQNSLIQEATELMKIFGAIIEKTK